MHDIIRKDVKDAIITEESGTKVFHDNQHFLTKKFEEMIKLHPSKYHAYLDNLKCKYPSPEITVFGKPNVLVNEFQITDQGKHFSKTLSNYSVEELINMANDYSAGKQGQSTVMRKIFAQIEK